MDKQALITILFIVLHVINRWIASLHTRAYEKQKVVVTLAMEDYYANVNRFVGKRLLLALLILGSGWLLGGMYFDLMVGGYVVSLWVSVMISLQGIFYMKSLSKAGSAQGQMTLSKVAAYDGLADRLFPVSFFLIGLALLVGDLMLAGGAYFTIAFAFGYRKYAKKFNKVIFYEDPSLPIGEQDWPSTKR